MLINQRKCSQTAGKWAGRIVSSPVNSAFHQVLKSPNTKARLSTNTGSFRILRGSFCVTFSPPIQFRNLTVWTSTASPVPAPKRAPRNHAPSIPAVRCCPSRARTWRPSAPSSAPRDEPAISPSSRRRSARSSAHPMSSPCGLPTSSLPAHTSFTAAAKRPPSKRQRSPMRPACPRRRPAKLRPCR